MSYCRWSDDGFRCDLYCYADAGGGYTTHVAGSRYPAGGPDAPSLNLFLSDMPAYMEAQRAWREWADEVEMLPIGKQFDGQTFNDPTLGEFLDRVRMLREVGYNVPTFVDEGIEAEMADAA